MRDEFVLGESRKPTGLGIGGEIGRTDEGLATLRRMLGSSDPFSIGWVDAAAWCEAMGQRNQAFAMLDSAFVVRDYRMLFLNADPAFSGLRSDPRYAAFRRRMRLPA